MAAAIRLANEQDAEAIQAIYAPIVRDTVISFEWETPGVTDIRQRIRKTLDYFPWLVCESGDALLGYAYASTHRTRAAYQWAVDVSVYVHTDAYRRGVGRAVYHSLFQLLALQGFYNAYAGIALPNEASVGLHESMGFSAVGVYQNVGYKFDRWHDVGWWQLALQPHAPPPAAPLTLSELSRSCDTRLWQAALSSGASMLK